MEIEFKFQVPEESRKAVERELRAAKATRKHLQALYFDTADGALAAHGVVLRLRKEGRRWTQTAKATGNSPLHRLEHNVDLGVARAGWVPAMDIRRHDGSPLEKLFAQCRGSDEAPLVETFATDIWRLACNAQEGGSTVELAFDIGQVITPPRDASPSRAAPVCEFELELVDGRVEDLVSLAARWSQEHRLWFSTVSKAERGMRLVAAQETVPAVKARPIALTEEDAAAANGFAIQRAVVASCLDQILPNAGELAAGSDDAEQIHQLRVGIRRLRTALRELDALGGHFDDAWEAPLSDVFRALGAQRDRELLLQAMQPRLQAAGAPTIELPPIDADDATPVDIGAAVRSSAFQATLVALIGFAALDHDDDAVDPEAARQWLRKRLGKLHQRALRDGKEFESLASEQQHGARKRLKRLRYLAEFVAPLFDANKAARYVDRLAPAQDALGEFNDEAVALETYRDAAATDPRAWFAVGWFTAFQARNARACSRALAQIRKAPKFWKGGD